MTTLSKLMTASCLCLAVMGHSPVAAQSVPAFDIGWWDISSGGGQVSGGSYTLTGTIGQPDGHGVSTGGGFTLVGGFLHGTRTTSGLKDWALY